MRAGLWLALPLFAALTGCGDVYYQTRYIAPSAESLYSPAERVSWSGDLQVYELPSKPPAVDSQRERKPCLPPNEMFKPQPMLGLQDHEHHLEYADLTDLSGWKDTAPRGPKPLKAYPLYAWYDAPQEGAKEPKGPLPIGLMDNGPWPHHTSEYSDAPKMADWRDDERNWCDADR
jgi:hypothetical protein